MNDQHSSKVHGYHLFFEVSGALKHELSTIIATLANEYGGPVFPPHVTLLSHIPAEEESLLMKKAEQVASLLRPIKVTLGELATEDSYFRALYSKVNEVEMLAEYRAKAESIFSIEDHNHYNPHVSLLYGNYPEEQKRATIATLALPENPSFLAESISLYKTEGEVTTWRNVAEFPLLY